MNILGYYLPSVFFLEKKEGKSGQQLIRGLITQSKTFFLSYFVVGQVVRKTSTKGHREKWHVCTQCRIVSQTFHRAISIKSHKNNEHSGKLHHKQIIKKFIIIPEIFHFAKSREVGINHENTKGNA